MNLKGMLVGIQTIQPYYDRPDGYEFGAEHDQIWLYATQRPMSQEDVQKMIDAGWFQEGRRGDDPEFAVKHYAADEAWTCYV